MIFGRSVGFGKVMAWDVRFRLGTGASELVVGGLLPPVILFNGS